MGNYKAEIGKRVSYLRNLNGLTQETLAKYIFLSEYFHCSLDYLLKGINSDDVSSALPANILEILRGNDSEERQLLLSYLNMYSRIKDSSDHKDHK